ncbi:MAG TPA: homocysteine S-methyltransferase family protein [Sphingobacteriaceae bacterium]
MKNGTTLPNESDELFLTDGGLETSLIFLDGFDLPYFAAFDLLKDPTGFGAIREYYRRYLDIAKEFGTAFILETPTWRANPDWIERLAYPASALEEVNRRAVQLMIELKTEYRDTVPSTIISGCVGPRGDGYNPQHLMSVAGAAEYHAAQISAFSHSPVDMVTAITMNYVEEAAGICQAASAYKLPIVISFTLETDGRLPAGMHLKDAIERVDETASERPLYYMINCAHPTHFTRELEDGKMEPWLRRIRGVRANASCKSHAELDGSTELDRGNPEELALENLYLKNTFSQFNVFGGCCGTDSQHIRAMARLLTQHMLTC